MKVRSWPRLVIATLATSAVLGVAQPASAASSPAAAATAYLQARAAAVTAPNPSASLGRWLMPGSALAANEALMARGAARRALEFGHAIESATCDVDILDESVAADGRSATVTAHAIVTTTWRSPEGALDTEATGIDHTLSLNLIGNNWRIAADVYTDVMRPSFIEAAGASQAAVRRAGRTLERAASGQSTVTLPTGVDRAFLTRRYHGVITYDRAAAQTYADGYALRYNPSYVRFGADCANFASQCAAAGHMPQVLGTWSTGWWYRSNNTSSPSDDSYGISWINVPRQMDNWNGRTSDWAASAGALSRGDFVYYDWTGDGVWDHVAVIAGTNSAGQKIIDAHTTDYYHVYWKLGSSATRYKFANVRAQWIV